MKLFKENNISEKIISIFFYALILFEYAAIIVLISDLF